MAETSGILSAQTIRRYSLTGRGIVSPLEKPAMDSLGNSFGLSACGVDIRLHEELVLSAGTFRLASSLEHFDIPADVVGIVHDKSSLARRGVAVQNTVLEPGWRGYLTLEISNHGSEHVRFPAGSAIAQVIFHRLDEPTELVYDGKYQDQEQRPVGAR
jgi:dCTP deaminase